jgi:hypothetical protein
MYNVWSSVSARLGWQRSRWLAFCLCVLLGLGFLVFTSHGDVRAASTYQVRVFGTDGKGNILGVGGNGSVLSYADFMRGGACFT